jgi:WD40 repeat protein
MSEIVEVGGAGSEKDDIKYESPHNGKHITKIEISPEEKYLVTYSQDDNSIFGWSINGGGPKPDNYRYDVPYFKQEIKKMCVSDDKKLAYIYKIDNRLYSGKCQLLNLFIYHSN